MKVTYTMFTFESALSFYFTKFVTKQDEWQNTLKYNKTAKTTFKIPKLWIFQNHTSKCKKITASLLYLNILYVIFEIYASLERFYTNQLTLLATFKTLNAIIIDSDRSDNTLATLT